MATTTQISNAAFADALQRARQLATKIGSESTDSGKRPLEDSGDNNPSKRPFLGGGMTGGPGMDGVMTEQWSVPDSMVGLIIGRGGEQITALQAETQCRVQLCQEGNGQPDRPVTLTGTRGAIELAKERIEELMSKANMKPPAFGGGMGFGGGGGGGGGHVVEMNIPGTKVGLIIGKGGETLKSIQDRTGVRMTIIQESNTATPTDKPLRIMGDPQSCEHAKQLVEEILTSRDFQPRLGGFGGGAKTNDYGSGQKSLGEVIVPRQAVGVIIGKGGEMIKRLQMETGAKVQFKLGEDPEGPERTACITGSPEQIQQCTQMITDLVSTALTGQGTGYRRQVPTDGSAFLMTVPANKTGLIIGKGGETIKQINQESGAHVELSRDAPPNEYEKIFIIKGSPQAQSHAQHLIKMKIGDLPPGTPAPATGGYAAPNPYGGGYPGYNPADPNAAAWAAYYAQYYQAAGYYPQATSGAQPAGTQAAATTSQAGSGATGSPAINPQTGQPDYSAQWAEYYRSMGMHDQAALIEQQAKTAAGGTAQQQQVAAAQQYAAQQQQSQQQDDYERGGGQQQRYQ